MFSMFPPGHPLHNLFAADQRQWQAFELPPFFLRHTLLQLAGVVIESGESATLVGTRGSEVWICTCGCQRGAPGTYTVLSDAEVVESLANEEEVGTEVMCAAYRVDGRAALIIPGHETPNPW